MINILKLRHQVMGEYHNYVQSFLDIRDRRLREYAEKMLDRGDLWPDPLLQCNPGFEKGETVEQLIESEVIHHDMGHIFNGFHLHKHQAEAIKLGSKKKGFIVTSGTGSGKSLTYLGSIFNHVLQQPGKQGVTAIIVYPMNALINSQELEIRKYQRNFMERHLKPEANWEKKAKSLDQQIGELTGLSTREFPITFGKYTGQESTERRRDIIDNPPHILLTNYMMLELLLTRNKEAKLRDAIFAGLKYLVFDELHTYRGRQGADVALLIRRMKALAKHDLVCMGTSATLSSGSISGQKEDVAHLGKQLFDESFGPEQIIIESLKARISRPLPAAEELKEALSQRLLIDAGVEELEAHPLAAWMEQEVALSTNEGVAIRGVPQTIPEIAEKLANFCGVTFTTCKVRIGELLQWLQRVNRHLEDGIMPFRVHQFVAQTGTIRVTLEPAAAREIVSEEKHAIFKGGQQLPLFPIVFNRHSGYPYIRVKLSNNELKPWENGLEPLGQGNEGDQVGYLLLEEPEQEPIWNQDRAQELIPDTWIEKLKSGHRIRKNRAQALPRRIWFYPEGRYAFDELPGADQGWFMTAPLLLDPLSGVIYDTRIREFNKLAQLGDAGRSTSTTILTHGALRQLEQQQAGKRVQKVMSFSDDRQDAALQSGHFNDFMRQVLLRAAICKALKQYECRDYSNIANAVFDALGLPQEEFAQEPGTSPHLIRNNEKIFKKWLRYQLFFDLRRGWRHRLPNLEQCGLLEIRYKELQQICSVDENWQASGFLNALEPNQRLEFVRQFLNYFRSSFAVKHFELELNAMEESHLQMRTKLKPGWMVQMDEVPREPYWMRLKPLKSKTLSTLSIGPASSLGQYVRFFAKQHGVELDHKGLVEEMPKLLNCISGLGYLHCNTDLCNQSLYRLDLSTVEWVPGDPEAMVLDEVRNRSAKKWAVKPNEFFRELYEQSPDRLKELIAREHTGQVKAKEREEIEQQFREAQVKALFCSPTMELGIDIDELAVVHLRNVPPTPANYAQRSGRAGRKGQGALIITFCSEHSAHDRHFFRNKMDMVTGKVTPQQLDLMNPDLLRTHLHAAYLAKCKVIGLNRSLAEILDISQANLPILPSIAHQLELSVEEKRKLRLEFMEVIAGLKLDLLKQPWFSEAWITKTMEEIPNAFNQALQRWRDLYTEADNAQATATAQLRGAHLTKSSPEYKSATSTLHQSQRKLDLLRNKAGFRDFSEFYPFRYLAAEGFLPGYNFTRLPIRMYLDDGKGEGAYISRPRMLALAEFGPHNILYQNGAKWRVSQMNLPPSEGELQMHRLFIDKSTGYYSIGKDALRDVNPFSGKAQSDTNAHKALPNLVELQDMTAWASDRISCQEDERSKTRFHLELGFALRSNDQLASTVRMTSQKDLLLQARFFPSAALIRVNHKPARNQENEYFLIHQRTGVWKSESDRNDKKLPEEDRNLIREVKLFTSVTADCLYIEPQRTLNLSAAGVVTLMYAFKEAIQAQFQVEPREIACTLQGDERHPNILFYESSEGTLGILSRLSTEPGQWERLVTRAWAICRLEEDAFHTLPATYDDLLSYYNQPDHEIINRFTIKKALEMLGRAEVNITTSSQLEPA